MKPLIIYHRGRHGIEVKGKLIKENTLAAFEQAISEGAQMIEFDVWDKLRVTHDPLPSQNSATLPEVLECIAARTAVNIEIKSPAALNEVVAIVKNALDNSKWKKEQIVISSFHHQTAIDCKKLLPKIKVGAINDGVLLPSYIEQLHSSGINNLHLDWANIYMDQAANFTMRSQIQNLGMKIWAWTVNSKQVYLDLQNYGVEAVFTDRPELLN